MFGKITLKTKVCEFAFFGYHFDVSVCNEDKNRGCTKICEIYQVWTFKVGVCWWIEHNDFGSLGTPIVACKGEHDNKKEKMNNYMAKFLDELQ